MTAREQISYGYLFYAIQYFVQFNDYIVNRNIDLKKLYYIIKLKEADITLITIMEILIMW